MHGEFLQVWSESWRAVWSPLTRHPAAPEDLFAELYRELALALVTIPTAEGLADTIGQPTRARLAFRRAKGSAFRGELALVAFLERAHSVAVDLGGDPLANRYFLLIEAFLMKFSLRYDLRRPFALNPTLSGVFAGLVRELKDMSQQDAHLNPLMIEFEDAVRDLRADPSPGKIKTCIQKQVNLLEAMGRACPKVTSNTLGKICDEVGSWPHNKVKEAMKNLYGFASDYPGIRHGGTAGSAIRGMEMRDLVAVSVLLAGFAPYLSHQLDSDIIYRGR